jgi:hypothetical protein
MDSPYLDNFHSTTLRAAKVNMIDLWMEKPGSVATWASRRTRFIPASSMATKTAGRLAPHSSTSPPEPMGKPMR